MVKEWFRVPVRRETAKAGLAQGLKDLDRDFRGTWTGMQDERNRSLSTLLVLMIVLAILGVACWKLLARPGLGPYGAIAMSDSSLSTGGSWGYADPALATRRSIAECNKASRGSDCVIKVDLKNECGAVAISVQHNASFLGQSRDQLAATATAMARCQASGATDCAVHENICSSAS